MLPWDLQLAPGIGLAYIGSLYLIEPSFAYGMCDFDFRHFFCQVAAKLLLASCQW